VSEQAQPKPSDLANGKSKSFVERIENLHRQKEELHSAYMLECKDLSLDEQQVYKDAKGEGIPKKALKSVIRDRSLRRKLEAIREGLDAADQDSFDMIKHALGDLAETPLGEAALGRAA
jgi:uncharacterized protein (UPF0335 family)